MTLLTKDKLGRPLRDLRISVTDRCNFRCGYCMPRDVFGPDFAFLQREALLSFEEITRFVRVASDLGVNKLRITGGEPLVRKDLPKLISTLSQIDGIDDICLTTNGALLTKERALALKEAGLNRITISLDALDNGLFQQLADVKIDLQRVLNGIDNAIATGLNPVKVNMVVMKGLNDHAILEMVNYFKGSAVILRFIEFMDVGNSNDWDLSRVVTAKEIVDTIQNHYPIEAVKPRHTGEVAKRWQFSDGSGEIGIISSVSQPFCQSCTRLRLSAEGKLYHCLFAHEGFDLRELIRQTPEEMHEIVLRDTLATLWGERDDQYSLNRGTQTVSLRPKIEMSYIGG